MDFILIQCVYSHLSFFICRAVMGTLLLLLGAEITTFLLSK